MVRSSCARIRAWIEQSTCLKVRTGHCSPLSIVVAAGLLLVIGMPSKGAAEMIVRQIIVRSVDQVVFPLPPPPPGCPYPQNPSLFTVNATLYSIAERANDGLVVNETIQPVGTAAACAVLNPPPPYDRLPLFTPLAAYFEFTLNNGDQYAGNGFCYPSAVQTPAPGTLLAACVLELVTAPTPPGQTLIGGAISSMTVFHWNPAQPGPGTGSFWQIRTYYDAP